MNNFLERFYPEANSGGFTDIDGTIAFYARIQSVLTSGMTVLDVGCGRGAGLIDDHVEFRRNLRKLRGKCKKVIGIDVDPAGITNAGLDEFRLIEDGKWPIDNSSVDLIVSDFVLEHIADPNTYFDEVARVLRPDGLFCARTTNRNGYVSFASRVVPTKNHSKILGIAQTERKYFDVFPAEYRVNTIREIRRQLLSRGLDGVVYGYEAEPSYFDFSAILYSLMKTLHSLTPKGMRTCIFVFAKMIRK
ncbi:MAG: class I SAM-dependent methyltransferase [Hydrogenophilales bacterium]|nr:class I SAM-dependent methyltransferase [Hydrogenophilales bacterium]